MKKLLEFRAFDILKDEKNQEFLKKIKTENPDLYSTFVNIIGKKGLEIAKQEYEPYDPEYKKILKEKEKKDVAERKRQRTKEYKEELRKQTLKKFEPQINEIDNILFNSELYNVENYLKNDKNIVSFFKQLKIRKHYINLFSRYINQQKNLSQLKYDLFYKNMHIDTLYYDINWKGINKKYNIIIIKQYYNTRSKKFEYSIQLRIPQIKTDDKPFEFLNYRNKYINNLSNNTNLTGLEDKKELYNIIDKFSEALSDDFYQNWEIEQSMNKYNI